jgi:hypothetical protein
MNQASEQQKISDLAAELTKLGARVVSRVPSEDLILRFEVWAEDDERIIGELKSWGWSPVKTGAANHFDIVTYGTVACNSYSVKIPVERTPVLEDGKAHFGKLAEPKKEITEADKLLAEFNRKK